MRRAITMAAGEQYLRLVIQFALIVVASRLLNPAEIGVSVIGMGIMAVALGLREFATSEFLIQRREVSRDDLRASFTILLLLTALITVAMLLLAPWLASLYGEKGLARFLQITAIAGLIETASFPIIGLLRREMAFGILALIGTMSATLTALVAIPLVLAGFSYMSFAWAAVAGAAVTTISSFCFWPDLSMLRPTLKSWRGVLTFGAYNGTSYMINRLYETLPQLVLGRMLPPSDVGLYSRARALSDIPDKIILTSVFSVAFPALAAEIRQSRSLKGPYLRALSLITVFYWPGQALLVLLAFPIVSLVLGHQWREVAPVLQVMAIATFAWFPMCLTSPILLAVGANRDRVMADLIGRSVSTIILCSAAPFGIMVMAASRLVTLPSQMMLSFCFVRRHVAFRWRELGAALWRSAIVTAGSAGGPICVVALSDTGFELSVAATVVAVLLAGLGWLAGVLTTQHPILVELSAAIRWMAAASPGGRRRARTIVRTSSMDAAR